MKNINWWKVASMAMLAASAIMGFGHDLIEDQKTKDDLRDMVQEELNRLLDEKGAGFHVNLVCIDFAYGEILKELEVKIMFDREYFKQVDSVMLGALKVLGQAMLSALDVLIWYLLLQPIRLYSWLTDDPAPVKRRGAYKNRHCAEDRLY